MPRTLLFAALHGWLALVVVAVPAGAQNARLDTALARLVADNFADTAAAVEEIARSGAPQAADLIQAIADRRLGFDTGDKAVYFRDANGKLLVAATSKPAEKTPAELTIVRLNNRVRSAVQAALGGLDLMSPDPAKRLAAASTVLKSRNAEVLPVLQAALARESDAQIRSVMQTASASIVLLAAKSSDPERLAAIETLRQRSDQGALSTLRALPGDGSLEVREAADRAIRSIEQSLMIWAQVQNLWYGLSLGSVLLLAAIGLAITFGVMGVINMAHGEMVMLGAYTTFMVQEVIRTSAPAMFGWSLAISIPLAFFVAAAVGIAIERGIIRFLYGRPLETLLATWGVSLVLQQLVRSLFGPTNREVGTPAFMTGAFEVGGLTITWNRLYIILFAAAIFVSLLLALKHTRLGLHMRAVTQNRRMAGSMGIPTGKVDALTFGLGSGIAGLAGVALSQIDNVSPNLGQSYIIDSFLVVVLGGVGNLWGTLVGALTLGIANKLLEPWAGAVLGKIVLLVAVIVFIQKRPRGMFALKGRAVEA